MTWLEPFFKLRRWPARGLLLAIGLVAQLGFAPFHLWAVTLLCLSLFFAYLWKNSTQDISSFWMTLWFGLGYFMGHIYWIGVAFIERGPEFIPIMPPMILGLALLKAFIWAVAAWVFQKWVITKPGIRWPNGLALLCLFMLAELTRGHIFGGLPWNLPGYVFEAGQPMSQIAALVNIYGVSFIALAISIIIAQFWLSKRDYKGIIAATLIIFGLFGYGTIRLTGSTTNYHPDINLRLVQIPFSQNDRIDPQKNNDIITAFIRESLNPGIEDTTHLIWPEGAVPGLVLDMENLVAVMGDVLTRDGNTPPLWMFNTLRHETIPSTRGVTKDIYYSSSAAISFNEIGTPTIEEINDKYRMVPFGELIPGGGVLETLGAKTISLSLASLSPTDKKTLAMFPGLPKVSAQICYEIVFPGLTPTPDHAEWILNQSNDAWFKSPTGPYQHANIAAYRAIETGLPIIRSASNGVTGVIDSKGRYIHKMDIDQIGTLDVNLPIAQKTGQKTRAITLIIALISILGVLISAFKSRKAST